MTTTAAAAGTRRHTGTYPAEPRQVGLARAALAGWLGGGPRADEAILVASEFATNSVLHSSSRCGGAFTLRAEVHPDCLRIDDVHDPVRADPQPVIPASVESLCGVWIIGQGGDGCADSTHAILVSHVTAR